ncbi:MAG TPA: glycosyltransferase family 4 protein [Solirubrobacteraceae bacterium]|nr:glycosyltransferase family 4 protein [Solirubrobacteraceae bacterium]
MPGDRIVSIQTTEERGGAEYANVDLLQALVDRGHDVVLLTNVPDIAAGTDVRVRVVDLGPKLTRRSVGVLALRAPLVLVRIARALRAERPVGVTLLHFKKEQLLCSLLPRRLTGAVVWAEWGPVPVQLRRGVPRLIYALAARRARRIVAISQGTRRTVVQTGVPLAKIDVVPNLVDVHSVEPDAAARVRLRAEWGAGEHTLVVGCISRFQQRKRNDVVIDAMADLAGDVLLVLAGEGEQEQALRERAAPYGERVRFVPNVRGHVEAFLSACDVLVFAPSPTEGVPRSIVMAQLVGVPVVATHPEGAEGLIPAGAGTIVSPHHDPHALAAVLAAYRDDRERPRREGELARRTTLQSHDPQRTLAAIERALGVTAER